MAEIKCMPTDRFFVRTEVTSRKLDGEWVLLDLRGGSYFGLDELGGIIWNHLSKGQSPAEIAALLSGTYDVSDEVLLNDVRCLVDELLGRDLIRLAE